LYRSKTALATVDPASSIRSFTTKLASSTTLFIPQRSDHLDAVFLRTGGVMARIAFNSAVSGSLGSALSGLSAGRGSLTRLARSETVSRKARSVASSKLDASNLIMIGLLTGRSASLVETQVSVVSTRHSTCSKAAQIKPVGARPARS
jgi:hypothetical protein